MSIMQLRVYCPHADSVTNEVNCLSSVFFWVHILGVIRIDASVYYIYHSSTHRYSISVTDEDVACFFFRPQNKYWHRPQKSHIGQALFKILF